MRPGRGFTKPSPESVGRCSGPSVPWSGVVLRRVLIGALLAVLAAAFSGQARAAAQVLMPNVSYQRTVQFTAHGPVVAERAHGAAAGRALPAEAAALERHDPRRPSGSPRCRRTSRPRRRSPASTATSSTSTTATRAGCSCRTRCSMSPPLPRPLERRHRRRRQAARRARLVLRHWQGLGQRRPLTALNQPPDGRRHVALHARLGRRRRRDRRASSRSSLQPFPPAVPNTDLTGVVDGRRTAAAALPIPPGGAVLLARGTQAAKLQAEAPPGTRDPDAPDPQARLAATGVTDALGGGPVLVRDGKPVFRAERGLHCRPARSRATRAPRSASSPTAASCSSPSTARQPRLQRGHDELRARAGAGTPRRRHGVGARRRRLDDDGLRRQAAEPALRPAASAIVPRRCSSSTTASTRRRRARPVVSPNGDGVAERQTLAYKIVRPSTVTASLLGPDGVAALRVQTARSAPGTYPLDWPGDGRRRRRARGPLALGRHRDRRPRPRLVGRARLLAQQHARLPARRAGARRAAPQPRAVVAASRWPRPATRRRRGSRRRAASSCRALPSRSLSAGHRARSPGTAAPTSGALVYARHATSSEVVGHERARRRSTLTATVRQVATLDVDSRAVLVASVTDSVTSLRRRPRRLRRLRADGDRRGLPGGERARDGLRGRARRRRVPGAARRRSSATRSTRGVWGVRRMALAGRSATCVGSIVGWAIGVYGGRPLLERHGRWLHLTPEQLDRAERWFDRCGDWAVFLGRITPVVRSFVSIPAGVFRMPFGRYTLLTLVGSAIWCFALRRRRLGARHELGALPPRLPLRRTTLSSPRSSSLAAYLLVPRRRSSRLSAPCRRSRSLTSRRSTRR